MYKDAVNGMTPEKSAQINIRDREITMAARETHEKSFNNMWKNSVARIFTFIGTLPEDHLIRHPFFAMVHDNEARRLAIRYQKYAEKRGMSAEETQKLIEDNAERIKAGATSRAYKELMQRMYSIERYTTPAKFLRFITPFYMAHQNSSRFWLGTSLRNPEVAYMLAKVYNAPYRAGMVYDDQGNQVESGTPWSTSSSKQTVKMGAGVLGRLTGRDQLVFNPTALDVITQGQLPIAPTFGGPAGEIIAKEGVKFAMKYTGADNFLKDHYNTSLDEVSTKYILPYYEKTSGASVFSEVGTAAMPLNSFAIS
jgi:hypothetical protein